MAALAIADEAGVEVVARSAWTSAIIVAVDLVALAAGRRAGAVAGGAVGGSEVVGVHLVQGAVRSALEAGVAGSTFSVGFAQRSAWGSTDVALFAVLNFRRN